MTNISNLITHIEAYIKEIREMLSTGKLLTRAQVDTIEALDNQLFILVKTFLDKDYLKNNHSLCGKHLKVKKSIFGGEQFKIEPEFVDYLLAFKEDLNPQDQYNSFMSASMIADKYANG